MTLIDSSVWIECFRGAITAETEELEQLPGREHVAIGDLILAEVLQGFTNERDFNQARDLLTTLPVNELAGEEIAITRRRTFVLCVAAA